MKQRKPGLFLGIECGGTRTVALLADANDRLLNRVEGGPANLRLVSDAALLRHFQSIQNRLPSPSAIGIGMAGARTQTDRRRVRQIAAKAWPRVPAAVTHDLETALLAGAEPLNRKPNHHAQVLVLSGTGSCCYGKTIEGNTARVGGWGHLLGDKGSGYDISLSALRAVISSCDRNGSWPPLGARLLRALTLNEPDELIAWVQQSNKADIAALAPEVFAAARKRDRLALAVLERAAETLAQDASACARRLQARARSLQFVLAGSIPLRQPAFAAKIAEHLKRSWPGAQISNLRRESAWGAVALARQQARSAPLQPASASSKQPSSQLPHAPADSALEALAASPTEQRNPRSLALDRMSLASAIALMLREDATIPRAIARERRKIETAINHVVASFKRGGRLIYVGAGTSGRLGVLDASECPPTFRVPPEMVQGIIAGGQRALWEAVEGAEDNPEAGAAAIEFRKVGKADTVMGIAASGRTPFVWGALRAARSRGAKTILLCCNPQAPIPRDARPDLVIAPNVGPEILAGSTRLKAGTATKIILNIVTTLAMVRMGKVLSNLMIDVKASNAKLRDRAVRIVRQLTGADYEKARAALERANWQIPPACTNLRRLRNVKARSARSRPARRRNV